MQFAMCSKYKLIGFFLIFLPWISDILLEFILTQEFWHGIVFSWGALLQRTCSALEKRYHWENNETIENGLESSTVDVPCVATRKFLSFSSSDYLLFLFECKLLHDLLTVRCSTIFISIETGTKIQISASEFIAINKYLYFCRRIFAEIDKFSSKLKKETLCSKTFYHKYK